MTTRTVLVLGAYGEAGAAIVRELCATNAFDVIGAGRSREKLSALARGGEALRTLQLDITDQHALVRAVGDAELVINCVGPFISAGAQVAQAAREAGAACFDIASEQEHYRRLRALDAGPGQDRGLILTGVGAYPGLSGILLKSLLSRFPDSESAEMAIITGPHAAPSAGGAQSVSGVVELAFELSDLRGGRLHRLRPGRRRRLEFPAPFGARAVLTWPQLEVLAAAEAAGLCGEALGRGGAPARGGRCPDGRPRCGGGPRGASRAACIDNIPADGGLKAVGLRAWLSSHNKRSQHMVRV